MGDDRGRIQIVVEYEMKNSPSFGFAKDLQQQQQSDKDTAGQSHRINRWKTASRPTLTFRETTHTPSFPLSR
jgi:hypothetical protein